MQHFQYVSFLFCVHSHKVSFDATTSMPGFSKKIFSVVSNLVIKPHIILVTKKQQVTRYFIYSLYKVDSPAFIFIIDIDFPLLL